MKKFLVIRVYKVGNSEVVASFDSVDDAKTYATLSEKNNDAQTYVVAQLV